MRKKTLFDKMEERLARNQADKHNPFRYYTRAKYWFELRTIAIQSIVLSAGFALVFFWEADLAPKALTAMILVFLVLIYAMPDRLGNMIQIEIKGIRKEQGITQMMIQDLELKLRELIQDKTDLEKLSSEEILAKAQEIIKRHEMIRSEFSESFERGFQAERKLSGADRIEFFADTLNFIVVLTALVGGSAIIGWLMSSLF